MAFKYRITDQGYFYFVTFTVVGWVDLFIRNSYRDIFLNSVRHCQKHKGLEVGAWVIMTSHVHMILRAEEGYQLQDIIRDLKSFTSRHIRKELENATYESRQKWMMWLFTNAGMNNSNNNDYQLWIQDNHPVQLATPHMLRQRLDYLHNNPVEAGFVCHPEDWKHSSAHDYCGGTQGMLDLVRLI